MVVEPLLVVAAVFAAFVVRSALGFLLYMVSGVVAADVAVVAALLVVGRPALGCPVFDFPVVVGAGLVVPTVAVVPVPVVAPVVPVVVEEPMVVAVA